MRRAICAGCPVHAAERYGCEPWPSCRIAGCCPYLPDLTPLRVNPAYRRLYAGFTLSQRRLADGGGRHRAAGLRHHRVDRGGRARGVLRARAAGGVSGSTAARCPTTTTGGWSRWSPTWWPWATSIACALQAWLGNENVWVLYALVAVWNGAFGVDLARRRASTRASCRASSCRPPTRSAVFAMSTAMMVGPLMAGLLVDWGGFASAYTADAARDDGRAVGAVAAAAPAARAARRGRGHPGRAWPRCSTASASCATPPNVRMTFVADIAAMLLAQPRVLFPAAGAVILGGGAQHGGLPLRRGGGGGGARH